MTPYPLPAGVRSRFVDGVNGLRMHLLEAGYETPGRPCLLLLHGFPELAYSWRKVMLPLAEAGYHVVAPDQRGYGLTTGWDPAYDGDLASFRVLNIVADDIALLRALGHDSVDAVIGHDFGSPVAAWCALTRPDVFHSVVLMSSPFGGPPAGPATADPIHAGLAALPRPRKHYQWYYSTREAEADMLHCPQGLHDFLRAYYHVKSADWRANRPHPLTAWTAAEAAKMPEYYIMDLDADMAQTVAPHMPSAAEVSACRWLTDEELRVYSGEFARTGLQGGLQWYRCRTSGAFHAELQAWAGRSIDVPCAFISGASDWGSYQKPGDLENMQSKACSRFTGVHFVAGAGHWVQQEQPQETTRLLLEFLRQTHA
ncbi:MAG: alpha/beta fold hydrolase [Burkholderiales bacterium]